MRLEAALPLYGHELREELDALRIRLRLGVKMSKADFVGRAALAEKHTPNSRVRALRMEGKAIPREGYPVIWGGVPVAKSRRAP